MAEKKKKPAATAKRKTTAKPLKGSDFKAEKEEKIDLKELAKDERTHKITGATFILIALFLAIAFVSYFFTWKNDQPEVFKGASILFADSANINNLLGRLGALASHFFIYKGFGVASLLICTFFLVVGTNLLVKRKVFSVTRNLKYVTLGLVVLSVSLAFVFASKSFPYGGAVGVMISQWMVGMLGKVGTAAVLILLAIGYFIWQFNPTFNLPERKIKEKLAEEETETEEELEELEPEEEIAETENKPETITVIPPAEEVFDPTAPTINETYAAGEGNKLKQPGGMVFTQLPKEDNTLPVFTVTEKEEETVEEAIAETPTTTIDKTPSWNDVVNKSEDLNNPIVDLHTAKPPVVIAPPTVDSPIEQAPEEFLEEEFEDEEEILPTPTRNSKADTGIALEIKTTPDISGEEAEETTTPTRKPNLDEPWDPTLGLKNYKYPDPELLENHGSEKIVQDPAELENYKNQIIDTLRNYSIEIQRISATVGPTVTLYEIVPAPGVRISRIKNLEDDIALSLAALGIRIIAPIPGKGTIGIEVPNKRKSLVSMKTLITSDKFQNNNFSLPIAIGKKIDNENFVVDLASMPHLLMAGATGQGKSVGLNAILVSLLYKKHPSQLKFVLVDPKKVELSIYRKIEAHFLAKLPNEEEAIITDTKKVINTLNALCIEMDNRYDLLKEAGCRNIKEYNVKFAARKLNPEKGHQFLPFIVLVVDEFADLIMTAGKEVEMPIARLAQLARAVGIHLIIATQRPSVNIITGTIKANFPARIAFKVSSKIDSRTILDTGGAEQLIGKGDMLISYNGEVVRLQCAFVDTPEVDSIVDFIGYQDGYPTPFLLPEYIDEKELESKDFDADNRDPLFEDAAKLIVANQVGSTSLLQRKMKLGYNRAGRLMDQLEAAGIVGPNQGSKAREVLIKTEMELMERLDTF